MGTMDSDADSTDGPWGSRTRWSQTSGSSPRAGSLVTRMTLAPRAFTDLMLETVFSVKAGSQARATTSVPSSMREMVPCLSSPAA